MNESTPEEQPRPAIEPARPTVRERACMLPLLGQMAKLKYKRDGTRDDDG
jgi:hypothetical protein